MPTILETAHYIKIKDWGYWKGKNGSEVLPGLGVSGADILRGVIRTMHATYIGFHGYVGEYLADNPDLPGEMLNLCGYWYFPESVSYPFRFKKGENRVALKMMNKGVAPAYKNYSLVLRFESTDPEKSFEVVIPDAGNRSWMPGETVESGYSVEIPGEAESGGYTLKFKLVKNAAAGKQDVSMGVKESFLDNGGFVRIGEVKIQ